MALFIVTVCHYNDLQIQNQSMLSSRKRGGEGMPFLSAFSYSTSIEHHQTQHDKIAAGLSAAGNCTVQGWLSVHRSISTSTHELHKSIRTEFFLCCSLQSSAGWRGAECAHLLKGTAMTPVHCKNRRLHQQIQASKWSDALLTQLKVLKDVHSQ